MNPSRVALRLVPTILASLVWCCDLSAQVGGQHKDVIGRPKLEKMPDISGDWLSDSPLDYFVKDDSPQPVNKFRIEKSEVADFLARYIGSRATGVNLKWSDKDQQFEGTMKNDFNRGDITFVVKVTADPDVLKCKILADHLINADEYLHNDQWTRLRGKPGASKPDKTPGTGSTETKEATKTGASEDQKQTTVLQYEDSPGLSPDIKTETEKLLVPYMDHLKSLGFELQRGHVVLRLQQGMGNAHYYHTNRSIVMDSRVARDESTMRREFNHHALAVAQGDHAKDIFEKCSGIESALADYLGCSHCDDPEVGRLFVKVLYAGQTEHPYLRTMDNLRSFTEIEDASGRHNVGEVVSGALWEMRGTIGKETLDPLLYKAWTGIRKVDASQGQVLRFALSLLDVAQSQNPETARKIRAIFERRGLTLP